MKTRQLKQNEETESYVDSDKSKWQKIICVCGKGEFEVIETGSYETSVKCVHCGFMDIVHDG